jgi:RNA polymerase-interacting CarD/CdnL/TRCF family regulator
VKLTAGQWLVHTHYGVGQILKKEKRSLEGVTRVYYCVKISEGEYWLAVENAHPPRIRRLSSEVELLRAREILQMPYECLPEDRKERTHYYKERLELNSLDELAKLVRDIFGRKLENDLSYAERQHFEGICQQFVHEWMVVVGISREAAQHELRNDFEKIAKQVSISNRN